MIGDFYPSMDAVVLALADENVMTEILPSQCAGIILEENSVRDYDSKVCLASWPRFDVETALEKLESEDLIVPSLAHWLQPVTRSLRRVIWMCAMGKSKIQACEEISRQIMAEDRGLKNIEFKWFHSLIAGRNPEFDWHRGAADLSVRYSVSLGNVKDNIVELYDHGRGLHFS